MPKAKAAILKEWEALLRAVQENQGDLGAVAPYHKALLTAHLQAVVFKGLTRSLNVSAADASRHLDESLGEGQKAAVKLRAFIRSVLGLQSEKLRRYGMKPFLGHPRRRGAAPAGRSAKA